MLFIFSKGIYTPILNYFARFRFIGKLSSQVLELLKTSNELLSFSTISIGIILSVIAWGLEAVCFYLVLHGMHLNGGIELANFTYSVGQIIGAVTLSPGGVGTAETGMFIPLKIAGISAKDAAPAILLFRFCTLWFVVVVGVIIMIPLLRKRHNA